MASQTLSTHTCELIRNRSISAFKRLQMHPGKALFRKGIALWPNLLGIIKCPDVKMNLGRPAIPFIGQRGPAILAETSAHAFGRCIRRQLPPCEAHIGALVSCKRRHRGTCVLAAGMTMAKRRPFWRARYLKPDRPAQTSALQPLHHQPEKLSLRPGRGHLVSMSLPVADKQIVAVFMSVPPKQIFVTSGSAKDVCS